MGSPAVPPWLDLLPVGLAVFAADGAVVFANPRFFALLGLAEAGRPQNLAGVVDHVQRFGRTAAAETAELIAPVLGTPFGNGRIQWRREDGAVIDIACTALPDGGCMLTLSDVSTLAAAEAAAQQAKAAAEAASQAKSRFLATMGRELRAPLNAVIGFAEAMLREADQPSSARVAEFARQINESGRNLLGLINVILDVASVESGQFELAADPVDVARLVRTAIRQGDAAAQAAEITLAADLPRTLPKPRGDEQRLMQVLVHLLSNAVKFTASGGTVTLGARREPNGGVLIFVQDTGTGIAPDHLGLVFEPFRHVDAAQSRRFQGAGLGLYMARALVAAHGGQLTLKSRLGEGTTAEIRLPA